MLEMRSGAGSLRQIDPAISRGFQGGNMRIHRCFILSVALIFGAPAAADIYRCSGESGEVLFSQLPCASAGTIQIRESSAESPSAGGLRDSERAWLREREQKRSVPRRQSGEAAARHAAAKVRQAYHCRRKRADLEAIGAKMRRGYKPAQGEKLRRRRRGFEDYLAAFCP